MLQIRAHAIRENTFDLDRATHRITDGNVFTSFFSGGRHRQSWPAVPLGTKEFRGRTSILSLIRVMFRSAV